MVGGDGRFGCGSSGDGGEGEGAAVASSGVGGETAVSPYSPASAAPHSHRCKWAPTAVTRPLKRVELLLAFFGEAPDRCLFVKQGDFGRMRHWRPRRRGGVGRWRCNGETFPGRSVSANGKMQRYRAVLRGKDV
jgi:hypothetical protein